MYEIAQFRIINGFFSFPVEWLALKHIFLHYIMSNLYLTGSFHTLDISVQNTLFSIYTAVLIASLVKLLGGDKKQIRWALILAIMQPFSMISTMIFRDIVGQFFVILGLYLVFKAFSKSTINLIWVILLASVSMFLQRLIYAVFPLAILVIISFFKRKGKYQLLFVAPLIIALLYFNSALFMVDDSAEFYGKNITGASLWIFLPINIIRLFIGPFPWTNWFIFDDNHIFIIGDYLQAVVNVTFVFYIIKYLIKYKLADFIKNNYLFFVVSFSLFMFSALGTVDVHIVYMSTATVILIPVIVKITNSLQLKKAFVIVFTLFLVLNVLLIAFGLTGQGIGRSFR